jgi:hypothetical protein
MLDKYPFHPCFFHIILVSTKNIIIKQTNKPQEHENKQTTITTYLPTQGIILWIRKYLPC